MSERILITGATGCIGKACIAWLKGAGWHDLVSFTRSKAADVDIDQIVGDITKPAAVEAAITKVRPVRIIHLAALQTPDCQAKPLKGMSVNVEGTHHVMRAATGLSERLRRIVFASSAAVYGPRAMYTTTAIREDQGLRPPNLYGHWKVAGEGATQAFQLETGVPSISLRLATTYGPGRNRGLTSAPTSAMKAIVAGARYEMPYQGREHYHYSPDVGAAFALAAVRDFAGYGVFNLRGHTVATRDFIGLVQEVAEDEGVCRGEILMDDELPQMPFVCDLDESAICSKFPEMPKTELRTGIRESLRYFAAGRR